MSAIFGVLRLDGAPADAAAVERMAAALAFMGPDAAATAALGPARLGHRLLDAGWAGRPPEGLEAGGDGHLLLAADVRLDNREELAEALNIAAAELTGLSDPALVLRAYGKWGDGLAAHLLGDFAFALYDARAGRLVCARDPFGARPLFYHRGPRAFVFASAIPALFAAGGPSREIDPYGVASYLLIHEYCDDLTLYRDIRSLDGGHSLVIEADGRVRKSRDWQLDPDREMPPKSADDAVEGFRERLHRAVRVRLPGSGPVATAVSGGLDSSVVTAVAAGMMDDRALIGVANVEPDDARTWPSRDQHYARLLAERLPPLRLHEVARTGDPLEGRADHVAAFGSPVHAPLLYGWNGLFDEARRQGCRVLLTGIEGDWGVSGYGDGYIAALVRRGQWRRAAVELRAMQANLEPECSLATLFKSEIAKPLTPRPLWDALKRLTGRPIWRDVIPFGGGLARELDLARFTRHIGYHAFWHKTADVRRNEYHTLEGLRRWGELEGHSLRAARFDLHPVFPLMDARLVEYYLALPASLKFADGVGRQVMRRAAAGLLPDALRRRVIKGPFEPGMLRAMLTCWPRVERTLHAAADEPGVTRYVDVDRVLRFVAERPPRTPGDFMRSGYYDIVWPGYYMADFLLSRDRMEQAGRPPLGRASDHTGTHGT